MRMYTRHTSPEIRQKAEQSRKEAEELIERALICPECGFRSGVAYSDAAGHFKIKCQKCKTVSVLNLAYFRRQRQRYRNIFPTYRKQSKYPRG